MVEITFMHRGDLTDKIAFALKGKLAILDIAFNGIKLSAKDEEEYQQTTKKFIQATNQRIRRWIDHHPHRHWQEFKHDSRFILKSKKEAPACALLVRPELVVEVDTIIAHDDFDGVMSAAKYALGGYEPYIGANSDAIVADTRIGNFSEKGARIEAALKANLEDNNVRQAVFRELTNGRRSALVDMAAIKYGKIEFETMKLAQKYIVIDKVAMVEALESHNIDLTMLLVLGQKLTRVAIVKTISQRTGKEVLKIAGPNEWDFVSMFELAGGTPNKVTLPIERLEEAINKINQG